ncbi:MAG: hypothetical protein HY954_06780 [Deltaproteobacteria bacterium]|nr:hypothetical protein [Deltaproteobacteria bacterium]
MASENRRIEILNKILELSARQKRFLDEKRFEELFVSQKEREGLFTELKGLGDDRYKEEPLKGLIARVLEQDKVLSLSIESSMGEIIGKIGMIRKGSKASKAYSAR